MQLDEIDIKILHHLQREARISNVELADRVGLSPAPCLRRVRALEQAGVIQRYAAILNPRALDLNVTVLVQVSLDRQVTERFQAFEEAARLYRMARSKASISLSPGRVERSEFGMPMPGSATTNSTIRSVRSSTESCMSPPVRDCE